MQEGLDQHEGITALQQWLLQPPSSSSAKRFACTSKARSFRAGFAAARNLGCCSGEGGSKSLASFDFLLKEKEVNCTSFGQSATPTAQHNKQLKGKKYPKKPPCETGEVMVKNSSHTVLPCPPKGSQQEGAQNHFGMCGEGTRAGRAAQGAHPC